MKNYNRFMTAFWLVAAIAGLLMALYFMATEGFQRGSAYLIFPLMAGMMYGFRKFMTARMEKQEKEHGS